ncbi:MAG: Uma2 family endonuclease [Chloroflexota bacterium]|nr:Uma2 family endonuclease [Chloroflexota bacterium]
MATAPALYRFTVDAYHQMGEAGIFAEDARVELIDGQIVEMSPIGDPHVVAVTRCGRAFAPAWVAGRLTLHTQNPVRLDRHNEPQPDVALARPGVETAPRPGEILLAIEVADTSLEYDRDTKVPLYARAGIPETWVLNVRDRALEVYREPGPAGYVRTHTYQPDQRVAAEAFPDVVLRVADLLPPPELERRLERAADRAREQGWELER